jgi:hypothetical protein
MPKSKTPVSGKVKVPWKFAVMSNKTLVSFWDTEEKCEESLKWYLEHPEHFEGWKNDAVVVRLSGTVSYQLAN